MSFQSWHDSCNGDVEDSCKVDLYFDLRNRNMKGTNLEERLAVLGALLVLIGVSFAAEDALAVDNADVTTTAVDILSVADNTIEIAEKANEEAAAKAIEALAKENGQDLDIRLDDHRTMPVAGRK
jgi:hypothetical protein